MRYLFFLTSGEGYNQLSPLHATPGFACRQNLSPPAGNNDAVPLSEFITLLVLQYVFPGGI